MYKKIASNTLFQIASKAITAFISIFLIWILTKYLPIELYGSYNKVYSYLWIFAFLADLGLYTITIREISQKKVDPEKIIGNVLTLRTILWLGIWILAFWVAFLLPWYHDTLTLSAIFIVGAFTLVSLINSSILALMQSQMKMEFSLLSVVAGKILNIILIALFLIFIFTDPSENSLAFIFVFIAWFFGILLNTLMNYIYAKRLIPIKYRFDVEYIKHIFKISLPYWVALFLSVVYFKVDIILLSLLESPEKADISIALYGLPMKIVEVLMVLGWFYLNSLLPSLTEKYSQKKYKEISKILWVSLKILLSFWLFIFMIWNLFATEIISIIATPEYLNPIGHIFNSVQALNIVFWVLVFHFLSLGFIYMMIAAEKQSLLLWINLIVTVINIVWNIILIPYFSFIGAAMVTLISQVILMCISWVIVLRKIPISWDILKSFVFTFLYAGAIFIVFQNILTHVQLGNITRIVFIAPIILLLYIAWEYFASKKLL